MTRKKQAEGGRPNERELQRQALAAAGVQERGRPAENETRGAGPAPQGGTNAGGAGPMQAPAAEQEAPPDERAPLFAEAPTTAAEAGRFGPVGEREAAQANAILQKYKIGKASLDERVVNNEQWYRLHSTGSGQELTTENSPDSAWLFNSLANKHADAMDNYPEPNVLPRAQDDEETAKELSQILPVLLEQNGYEQTYSDAWWYKLKHGCSVKGVFWNPAKAGGLGDVEIRLVDILNLFWEPGITDIQASRNVFHVELMDNEVILEHWPWAEQGLGSTGVKTEYLYDDTVDTSGKSLVVDWYYRKGGALHYCKYVGNVILYASENDPEFAENGYYEHGKYPYVFDALFPIAGSPVGFGYIDLMKGCQLAIDTLSKSLVRNADIATRLRYFVNGSSGLNEREFADLSNDLVHVDGNLGDDALRQIVPTPISDIYVTVLNNKIAELKETSGNRDYSQGATTSGVTAASAIAALQEAGSKLSRDMLKSAYRAYTQECYLCIELERQFYTQPRAFRITGEGAAHEFVNFDNTGLAPQPQGVEMGIDLGERLPVFDITVVPAKKSTYSKLSQNELAKELYQMGFFNPQLSDQALACLEMMDFDGKEKIVSRVQENGTLLQQLRQTQEQLMKASAVVDAMTGSSIAANVGASIQQTKAGKKPQAASEGKTTTTDGLGRVTAGDSLAVQARRRAQENANPGRRG